VIITSLGIGSLVSCRWNAIDLIWVHNLCVSNMLSMDLTVSKMAPNGGRFCVDGGWAATSAHVKIGLEICDRVFCAGKRGRCRAGATVGVGVGGGLPMKGRTSGEF